MPETRPNALRCNVIPRVTLQRNVIIPSTRLCPPRMECATERVTLHAEKTRPLSPYRRSVPSSRPHSTCSCGREAHSAGWSVMLPLRGCGGSRRPYGSAQAALPLRYRTQQTGRIPVYPPSLHACHSACFTTWARTAPSVPLSPSGVSLRSTLSCPALLPCCASSFPRHYRQGSGSRATVLRCAPTDARQPPPFAVVPHSLRRRQHRSNAPFPTPLRK